MSPAPFLAAPTLLQVHALAALVALGLGAAQLALPKGGRRHRLMGYAWAALLGTVAASSAFISRNQVQFGPFSWIHGLTVLTLVMLPLAILNARRGRISVHRNMMLALFTGALVVAGLFTLAPNRILGRVVFGG